MLFITQLSHTVNLVYLNVIECSRNISEYQIEKELMNLVFTGNDVLYNPAA
jgi:hypothetical protein